MIRAGTFFVYARNWAALLLFMRLETQWLRDPNGTRLGLNYNSVDVILGRSGLKSKKKQDKTFAKIQLLEAGALKGFSLSRN